MANTRSASAGVHCLADAWVDEALGVGHGVYAAVRVEHRLQSNGSLSSRGNRSRRRSSIAATKSSPALGARAK